MADQRKATLYRMVLPDHVCPFGLKAKQLLEEADYEVEEHILRSREEVEAYMAKEGVATTPQVFVDGKRLGGADDASLRAHLAEVAAYAGRRNRHGHCEVELFMADPAPAPFVSAATASAMPPVHTLD